MKLFVLSLLSLSLVACSTSHKEKSEVKEIETKLEQSQDVNGETLGIKDDTIVIQKKRVLAEELRELQMTTIKYVNRYNHEFGADHVRPTWDHIGSIPQKIEDDGTKRTNWCGFQD